MALGPYILFAFTLGIVTGLGCTLYRSPSQRRILRSRFGLSNRTSNEPPSPSGEKGATSSPSAPSYLTTLPPFRSKLATLPHKPRFVPLEVKWDRLDGNELTPTGFTVDEARDLIGSMPDYAKLSGVPLPEPVWEDWTVEHARPRPYRPLRWKYAQTMSLMKLDPSYWLELESTYVRRIKQRQQLYTEYGDQVLQCLPGAELLTLELVEHCIQFLTTRYPKHFTLSSNKTVLHNHILNTTTDLPTTPPLITLLNNVPEDFGIMQRDAASGIYCFRSGIICSALGWSLGLKIGKKLVDVHEPVPDFKEKMAFSMDRYFAKMPTDAPIQRGSWGLEKGEALFAAPGTKYGDELLEERAKQEDDLKVEDVLFRVDWQTLRRLPVTGAIVFNFKALFTPIEKFRQEPYIPALLQKVMQEGKANIMEYKGTWAVEHKVLPVLDEWVKEQEEKGLTEKEWDTRTLDESPFFPGWLQKWQKSMGRDESGDGVTGLGREY